MILIKKKKNTNFERQIGLTCWLTAYLYNSKPLSSQKSAFDSIYHYLQISKTLVRSSHLFHLYNIAPFNVLILPEKLKTGIHIIFFTYSSPNKISPHPTPTQPFPPQLRIVKNNLFDSRCKSRKTIITILMLLPGA